MKLSIVSPRNDDQEVGQARPDGCFLITNRSYQTDDYVELVFDQETLPAFYWVQLDAAIVPSLLYFTKPTWRYTIPTEYLRVTHPENESIYPETAFAGSQHVMRVWKAEAAELAGERNLAFNSLDQAEDSFAYPHAYANIETRHDPTFAARNAIDGYTLNDHHGPFPYQSWGINQDPEAAFYLSFGRPVVLTSLVIVLRADFPHDSYWTQGTITYSDGTTQVLEFEKTAAPQRFTVDKANVTGLTFSNLIKASDDSPFPALIEFQAFGRETQEGAKA